jgi:hypothetical protein
MWMAVIISWLVVWPALGRWVALEKNRSFREGVILGLLFGPFGVIVEALLPTKF